MNYNRNRFIDVVIDSDHDRCLSQCYNGNHKYRKDEDMLTITEYRVELVKDPFGILTGKRYEFILDLEVMEDDELYSEHGVQARVILKVDEHQASVIKYELLEKATNRYLDFDLEPEEEEVLSAFCKEHLPES